MITNKQRKIARIVIDFIIYMSIWVTFYFTLKDVFTSVIQDNLKYYTLLIVCIISSSTISKHITNLILPE